MARTAIPVAVSAPYQAGVTTTITNGDDTNDHSVDLSFSPDLVLFVRNTLANTIAFTIEFPAGNSTYNATASKSFSLANGDSEMVYLDVPQDIKQSGNVLHIDSADPNFSELDFIAYTWVKTPKH